MRVPSLLINQLLKLPPNTFTLLYELAKNHLSSEKAQAFSFQNV